MTNLNSAPAPEAAHDTHGPAMQDGYEPQLAGETNFEHDDDGSSDTTPSPHSRQPGMTPLEQVTDWAELERRLTQTDEHAAAAGSNPAASRGEENDGGEAGDGETPPDAPLPQPENPEDPNAPAVRRELPRNFRLHTQDPQRARFYQLLRQHPEANPGDLAREAGYGEAGLPEASKTEEAAQNPKHDADPRAALRETIADLAQRKRACREAYDFEQADALTEQLQAAQEELGQHEKHAAQAGETQAEFMAAYREARAEATTGHPALAQEGSRQNRLARLLVAAKEQQAPEFFEDPGYPLRLVRELEREFPDAFPRQAGDHAPRTTARSRPLGEAVAGTASGAREMSRAQLERQIDQLSAEQLLALAHKVGTPTGGWD
jgi:hypothetical protein